MNSNNIDEKDVKNYFNNTSRYLNKNAFLNLRIDILKDVLKDVKNKEFIDIGCGNGTISSQFVEDNNITFVDLSDKMLEVAKSQVDEKYLKNTTFINSSINELDLDKQFDIVMCIGVLAHVPDFEDAIKYLSQYTKEGGLCIVQISDNSRFLAKLLKFYDKVRGIFVKSRYNYSFNNTTEHELIEAAKKYKLEQKSIISYWPMFPGSQKFPEKFSNNYIYYTFKNKKLAKCGSELIVVFTKS